MNSIQAFLGESGLKILFLSVALVIFYFFIIRPKQQEENTKDNFLQSLKKGMQIVTIGGVYGKIHDVGQTTIVLEIDRKGSQITFAKAAISIQASQELEAKKATVEKKEKAQK